jgi:hypothetical protein
MKVAPRFPVPLILNTVNHDSQQNISCDAVAIPCVGCLVPHNGPCAPLGPVLLLSEIIYPAGGDSSIASSITSTDSLPSLKAMSEGSSDLTMYSDNSVNSVQMVTKWNQFHREMLTELPSLLWRDWLFSQFTGYNSGDYHCMWGWQLSIHLV